VLILYLCADGVSWGQQTRAVAMCRQMKRMGVEPIIVVPQVLTPGPLAEYPRHVARPTWTWPGLFEEFEPDAVVADAQPWGTYSPAWSAAMNRFTGRKVFVRRTYQEHKEAEIDLWIGLLAYDAVVSSEPGCLIRDADELIPRHRVRQQLGVRTDEVAVLVGVTPRADARDPFRAWVRGATRGTRTRLIEVSHWPLLETLHGFDAAIITGGQIAHECRITGLPFVAVPVNSGEARRVGHRPDPAWMREWVDRVTLRTEPIHYVNPAVQMARDVLDACRGTVPSPGANGATEDATAAAIEV